MNTPAIKFAELAIDNLSAHDKQVLIGKLISTPAPQEPDRLIRPKAAALRLGCTSRTIFNLLKAGNLTRVKLPGRTRGAGIRESEIAALIGGAK